MTTKWRGNSTFDRRDLLHAWLQGLALAHAHEDLSTYYRARSTAMQAAFGVCLDKESHFLSPPEPWPSWVDDSLAARWPEHARGDRRPLHLLLRETAREYQSTASPFAGWIEVPHLIWVLSMRHGAEIHKAIDRLTSAHIALMLDLLELMWGLTDAHTVHADALKAHGFDPTALAPDPEDYW